MNGSFEQPVVALAGVGNPYLNGDTFSGWKVIGAPGSVLLLSGKFDGLVATYNPHSGMQTLDLTGAGSNTASGVEQTVPTQTGRKYALSFWIGNLVGAANSGYGVDSTALVEIDGSQVFTAKNSAGHDLSQLVWQNFCVPFTAKSDSTAIGFVNGDPSNDTSNILDDVMLEPAQ